MGSEVNEWRAAAVEKGKCWRPRDEWECLQRRWLVKWQLNGGIDIEQKSKRMVSAAFTTFTPCIELRE